MFTLNHKKESVSLSVAELVKAIANGQVDTINNHITIGEQVFPLESLQAANASDSSLVESLNQLFDENVAIREELAALRKAKTTSKTAAKAAETPVAELTPANTAPESTDPAPADATADAAADSAPSATDTETAATE